MGLYNWLGLSKTLDALLPNYVVSSSSMFEKRRKEEEALESTSKD